MTTDKKEENIYPYPDDHLLKQVEVRLKVQECSALYSNESMDTPTKAINIMREVLSKLDREWVCVVNLDVKLRPVNFNIVSIGSLNQSIAPIQNILKTAILSNCDDIILLHNHPSGEVNPSSDDDTTTKKLAQSCKLMGMHFLDHIIVGGGTGKLYSYRENNYDMFYDSVDKEYIDKLIEMEDKSVAEDEGSYEVVYPRRHHR